MFFTGDGGATWKEAQAFDPPDLAAIGQMPGPEFDDGRPTAGTTFSLVWVSASAVVVVSGGDLAAFDVAADGKARRRWVRRLTNANGIERSLAVGNGEIWLRARLPLGRRMTEPKVCMFKVSDGSPVERGGTWPDNGIFLLANGSVFVADNDDNVVPQVVARLELTDTVARAVATTAVSSPVTRLLALEEGGILIFAEDNAAPQYTWDGKAANATLFPPEIDNTIIRKEYLDPDHVTPAELAEMIKWMQRAGRPASKLISTVANQHPEWSHRQSAQWTTEQYKLAAANHGVWNPPATMPATLPVGP